MRICVHIYIYIYLFCLNYECAGTINQDLFSFAEFLYRISCSSCESFALIRNHPQVLPRINLATCLSSMYAL